MKCPKWQLNEGRATALFSHYVSWSTVRALVTSNNNNNWASDFLGKDPSLLTYIKSWNFSTNTLNTPLVFKSRVKSLCFFPTITWPVSLTMVLWKLNPFNEPDERDLHILSSYPFNCGDNLRFKGIIFPLFPVHSHRRRRSPVLGSSPRRPRFLFERVLWILYPFLLRSFFYLESSWSLFMYFSPVSNWFKLLVSTFLL